ncbi:MAG: DUF3225 domain-containing protein [Planctomycetes bacterium]|nr:DUF3225 domain-containing protein [Planctomycetota bacterium]MBI3845375.1 DUF3225 domain-containing protein [Planctomycetota bacterium]
MRSPIVLLTVAVLGGCVTLHPDPSDEITLPVRDLITRQENAWNRGDLEGYMQGYWNSPDLVFFSGGDRTEGWKPVLERYQKRYKSEGKEMGHLTFSHLEVGVLGSDAAYARGAWRLDFAAAGSRPLEGLFTLVLKKKPEGWRIVHDHSSIADIH